MVDRANPNSTGSIDTDQGLTWRGIEPDDLDRWHELVSRIQRHDAQKEAFTRGDLADILERPDVDLAVDGLLGLDGEGTARAWARIGPVPRVGEAAAADEPVTVHLTGGVDPDWRGRGIGRALVEWQLSGARDRLRRSNTSGARIGCFVEEQMDDRHRLFRAGGFEPTRYFTELRRPLERSGTADVPDTSDTSGWPDLVPADPPEPERLRVVRFDRHPDANTVVLDAYTQAFTDQWAAAHTPESWRYTVTGDEAFRPDLSYLLVDTGAPGEPVIAFVLNAEYEEDWPEQGFSEGYTEYVGVVPEWRSRGLAGYLLGVSHGVFAARGHRFATLAVDSGNPTLLPPVCINGSAMFPAM